MRCSKCDEYIPEGVEIGFCLNCNTAFSETPPPDHKKEAEPSNNVAEVISTKPEKTSSESDVSANSAFVSELAITDSDIKIINQFSVFFFVDLFIRISNYTFGGGLALFLNPFLWIYLVFQIIFMFIFLGKLSETVILLRKRDMFYFSPGWAMITHFVLAHTILGYILPICVYFQSQKLLPKLNNQ